MWRYQKKQQEISEKFTNIAWHFSSGNFVWGPIWRIKNKNFPEFWVQIKLTWSKNMGNWKINAIKITSKFQLTNTSGLTMICTSFCTLQTLCLAFASQGHTTHRASSTSDTRTISVCKLHPEMLDEADITTSWSAHQEANDSLKGAQSTGQATQYFVCGYERALIGQSIYIYYCHGWNKRHTALQADTELPWLNHKLRKAQNFALNWNAQLYLEGKENYMENIIR